MAVFIQKNLEPTYVEHHDGSNIRCTKMPDYDLRALITRADGLVVCAPGKASPSRTMRAVAQRMWELHEGRSGPHIIDADIDGEIDIGISVERLELMCHDSREVYAGVSETFDGEGRKRSIAVVALAPNAGRSCNVVVRVS